MVLIKKRKMEDEFWRPHQLKLSGAIAITKGSGNINIWYCGCSKQPIFWCLMLSINSLLFSKGIAFPTLLVKDCLLIEQVQASFIRYHSALID